MSPKVIGIIGANGKIGSRLVEILSCRYNLKCAHRTNNDNLKLSETIKYSMFDLYDDIQLLDFCKGCDIVINCAGPSYFIKDRVALFSNECNAKYIDVFGANYLQDIIIKKGMDRTNQNIIACGSYPGLTGILPIWVKNNFYDEVDYLEVITGGIEPISICAACDILLSSYMHFGKTNSYYKNGRIVFQGNCIEHKYSKFLDKSIITSEFINYEIILIAKKLNINEVHFKNVLYDKQILENMNETFLELIQEVSENNIKKIGIKLSEIINRFSKGKDEFNYFSINTSGKKHGKFVSRCDNFLTKNSYDISASVISSVVDKLIKDEIENGVYWPFEIVNSDILVNEMLDNNIIIRYESDNSVDNTFSDFEVGIL